MNKSDLKLMEDWREEQETVKVFIDDIEVVREEHLEAIEDGFEADSNKLSLYSTGREIPLIVRPILGGEKYELLFGLGQLYKAKDIKLDTISVVIVNDNKEGLVSRIKKEYGRYWNLSDIKISKAFKDSKPSPSKIVGKAKRMMLNGVVDPITVDYRSKYLTDGYITYLLLKFRGIDKVEVRLR